MRWRFFLMLFIRTHSLIRREHYLYALRVRGGPPSYLAVVAVTGLSLSCTCTCMLHSAANTLVVVFTGPSATLSSMYQLSIHRISLSARRFYTPSLLKRTFSGPCPHGVMDQSPDLYEYTSGRWLCAVPPSP
jgi:hypothetical protein